MQKINRKQILNFSLVISGIIVVGLIILIITTVRDIKDISNEIYQKRVDLEIQYQSGLSLRDNIQQLDLIQPSLDTIDTAFVATKNTLAFINDLEDTAAQKNVEQIITIPERDPTEALLGTGPITIILTGKASDVLSLINTLDAKPYYITLNQVSINNQHSIEKPGVINAELKGSIYWR